MNKLRMRRLVNTVIQSWTVHTVCNWNTAEANCFVEFYRVHNSATAIHNFQYTKRFISDGCFIKAFYFYVCLYFSAQCVPN